MYTTVLVLEIYIFSVLLSYYAGFKMGKRKYGKINKKDFNERIVVVTAVIIVLVCTIILYVADTIVA